MLLKIMITILKGWSTNPHEDLFTCNGESCSACENSILSSVALEELARVPLFSKNIFTVSVYMI